MTQDKTILEGAKWNNEPQTITINYNFSEKMVNDYFRALSHSLKRLHDDLLLRKFGIPAKSKQFGSHYERLFLSIEKRTPFACENIYPKDYELMFDTYHNLRWMKNKVLGIRINAPDSLDWKGGSLNQSLEDIMHNSKVYATTYSKIPPSMYNSIEPIITRVFEALEAKVNELNKGHHSAVISEDIPSMENNDVKYDYPVEMLEVISKVVDCRNCKDKYSYVNNILLWIDDNSRIGISSRLAHIYECLCRKVVSCSDFFDVLKSQNLTGALKNNSAIRNFRGSNGNAYKPEIMEQLSEIRDKYECHK